ncbi:hypothetical protein DAPPUDRAFT_336532 [Daphnia pulex]|uniref:Uncharacterized protein n=1 Tax=Daphnia pulex TaxID=6669 RepID=E9HZV5_DAPPU|nr:hypothetical protein DAPPUDRAFT_336532 [Daphnia pulex]|eukprot:EFX62725.1 hypothetical protein DAPPUDRAFT_336532 [Daphnia pulex]
MCPSLVDVYIQVDEGFTDEELLGFRKLKQLKNFEIQTSPYLPSIISIRGGVIPLLQAHGVTLEQLYLTVEVTSEEVSVIIESCPNIHRLLLFLEMVCIDECFTLDDKIIEEACTRNSFKYLTKLKFRGCSNVSQKGIDFFLNEANPLSDIYLDDCGNVNPERMRTMAQEKHWNVKWNVED